MKAVIKDNGALHYVSEADMVRFITENSDMEWNDVCDFIRDKGISSEDEPITNWSREEVNKAPSYMTKEAIEWLTNFFDAHPFINKMILTFDD